MKLSNVWLCLSSGSSLLNVSKESHTILVILSLLKEMFSINCFIKLLERDLSDTELLRVATATALPPSRPSSPVQHLTNQFSTAQISSYPNTATTSPVARPFYTSGPHIPVKFQHADAIFRRSHIVSSQDKWDYTLPKLPTDVLNNISNVVDSLTDATPNPYELAKNHLLETYTPTHWQLAQQLLTFPHVAGVCPTTLMNQLLSLLPPGDHPDTMFLLLFLGCLPANISAQLTAPSATCGTWRPMLTRSGTVLHRRLPRQQQHYHPAAFCFAGVYCLHAVHLRSGRSRSRSSAPYRHFDYCNYHRRYGAAAHHCQAPCSWLGPLAGNQASADGS